MKKLRECREQLADIDKRCYDALAENLALREELDLLRDSYEEQQKANADMERVYGETRKLKHDMRNHLLVIASYLNEGAIEEARKYTSEIIDKMELEYSYISSGNALLNYFLNEKFAKAKEMGVYIKADIENISFAKVAGIDFSAIVGNLLDNAFDAACNSREKQLWIQVKRKRGYDTLKVSNSIDESVLVKNPKLETTKTDEKFHGIGLGQVKGLVSKYDGMFDVWEENDMFHVQVMVEAQESPLVSGMQ